MARQSNLPRFALVLAIVIPAGALLGAYGSQHFMGLHPCHLCLEQRWPHFAALGAALIALLVRPGTRSGRIMVAVAAGGIATSGGIAVFHAGVEAGLWEYVAPCTSTATGGNALEAIMAAPLIRCDEVAFRFLGISMAGWNAIVSLAAALVIAIMILRMRRTSTPRLADLSRPS